jgi:hypothetical protein
MGTVQGALDGWMGVGQRVKRKCHRLKHWAAALMLLGAQVCLPALCFSAVFESFVTGIGEPVAHAMRNLKAMH